MGTAYILISCILFFILGIIWTKKTWLNFLIKIVFFGMAICGFIIWLTESGYIIKV